MNVEQILNYFPPYLRDNPAHRKYLVKEYIQLLILDYLATSAYVKKLAFIGGTSLRLIKGLERFSEDLDFDCKNLTQKEFFSMTDDVIKFLQRYGFNAVAKDKKPHPKLSAFRRNIHIPGLLYDWGISSYKSEKFLIKIESEDQQFLYKPELTDIQGCGFYFGFPAPPDNVLCSMKISALIDRAKGRDFYDVMFLLGYIEPDYSFLSKKMNISDKKTLKKALLNKLADIDLQHKTKDFEHLLFEKRNSKKILSFEQFIENL